MRTTLTIDDDILETARQIAQGRKISVGEAISQLARRGLDAPVTMRFDPETGLTIFDVPPTVRTLTSEDVAQILDDADLEDALGNMNP